MKMISTILATMLVDMAQDNPESQFMPISLKYLISLGSLQLKLPLDSLFHKDCHVAADLASSLMAQFGLRRIAWFDEMEREMEIKTSPGRWRTQTLPASTFYIVCAEAPLQP